MAVKKTDVTIKIANDESLQGIVSQPDKEKATVIFAHGSGSSHLSPRNQYVASVLNESGIATVICDLLSSAEAAVDEKTKQYRFDIELLTDRLGSVTEWFQKFSEQNRNAPLGYFGASTGAAAALAAAARQPDVIRAIVSRGGRPDLVRSSALSKVTCATLLLVGGNDPETIRLNQKALQQMKQVRNKRLLIVPNAGHVFEEKGTIEEAARHAASWFESYLL